jgi:hypothetical protein
LLHSTEFYPSFLWEAFWKLLFLFSFGSIEEDELILWACPNQLTQWLESTSEYYQRHILS